MRDSQVQFLGTVPTEWDVQPAVTLARVLTSTVDKKTYEGEKLVKLCNYTDVYYGSQIVSSADFMIATASPEQIGKFSLRAGDVPFTKDSETADDIGVPAYVPNDIPGAVYGYHLSIFRPHDTRRGRFMRYVLESDYAKAYFEAKTPGVTRVGLSQATIRYFRVPTPPVEEAVAIADYLDRETAQIDSFIAKNEELVALLTERRTAAIARAVTGSRSGRADEGSVWAEGLPERWKLSPVKMLAKRVTDGAHISPETEGGVYDFVSTRDVSAGSIDFEGSLKTSPNTYSYMVRTGCKPTVGDVLYSKDGTIGETAVVRESREFVVASSLIIITPDPALVESDYLRYALSSLPLLEQAKTLVRGAGLPRLSVANLATVRVPFPPLEVQRELVDWLDQVTGSIDLAIAVARRSVELARERRAALISAAVTGKIDVGVGS